MKFSHCGRLLASAGQDNVVRIWVLKNAFDYFNNMRMKYNTDGMTGPCVPGKKKLSSRLYLREAEKVPGAILGIASSRFSGRR